MVALMSTYKTLYAKTKHDCSLIITSAAPPCDTEDESVRDLHNIPSGLYF